MLRIWSVLLSLGSLALAQSPSERGAACGKAIRANADKTAFESCLADYLKLATVNPPGSEEMGVAFLEAIFKEVGIPTHRFPAVGPKGGTPRLSLIATVPADHAPKFAWGKSTGYRAGDEPRESIILLNHIDVVDVFPEQWVKPELTFSGTIEPVPGKPGVNYLWGRGALDMKGTAMLQLFALAELQMRKLKLKRDVHFLAVADEEQSALGAHTAVQEIRKGGELEALRRAQVSLGEGGMGFRDALGKGSVLHAIGAEEKGGAWMKLRHADPLQLVTALARLQIAPRSNEGRVKEAKRWGCRLVGASTPKKKINVVPSRLELELACAQPLDSVKVRQAFEAADTKVTVTTNGNRTVVSIATASSGHGSVSLSQSALDSAALGLQRLGFLRLPSYPRPPFFRYYQTEATKELVDTIGRSHHFSHVPHLSSLTKWISWWGFLEQKALGQLGKQLSTERLFRTSCAWTAFDLDATGAEAWLDCRLIHPKAMGIDPSQPHGTQFASLVQKYARDPGLSVTLDEEWDFSASPVSGETLSILRRELHNEGAQTVTTILFPTSSDNHFFRNPARHTPDLAPVPSYGFLPLEVTFEEAASVHGSNERWPVAQTEKALRVYFGVVSGLSRE